MYTLTTAWGSIFWIHKNTISCLCVSALGWSYASKIRDTRSALYVVNLMMSYIVSIPYYSKYHHEDLGVSSSKKTSSPIEILGEHDLNSFQRFATAFNTHCDILGQCFWDHSIKCGWELNELLLNVCSKYTLIQNSGNKTFLPEMVSLAYFHNRNEYINFPVIRNDVVTK